MRRYSGRPNIVIAHLTAEPPLMSVILLVLPHNLGKLASGNFLAFAQWLINHSKVRQAN
jgi:hypothetical protein